MQIMLIAFSPNLKYDYIKDECPGKMIFTCLMGILIVKTKDSQDLTQNNTVELKTGESCIVERCSWRKTISGGNGVVFMEAIEGMYKPSQRRQLNSSAQASSHLE